MHAPQKIHELIERFDRNLDAYTQDRYNETQVRREFIDPFFKALGWDVDNEGGYAEAYKDVIHEDAIKVAGATKAPDYCFRIGGTRKFFLEAKKPAIQIKTDIDAAYQLRRYAWSAKLPLSILTDFEEFAVYDCRIKPDKTDAASKARTFYLTYKEYIDRWEEIAGIFSREAVLKGAFDRYAESSKAKRGTTGVDAAFLQEIERWRELLARNIALRNPQLTQRELNFAVQQTIDRLIFLRICEDRGIEPYGRLSELQNGHQVYQRLFHLFAQADDRYNSGIFHFKSERGRPDASLDRLTPELIIDDTPLKDILKNLYYPDSPYEFSVLPADILGQVYEQFLGKVIRLTLAHRAVVEDKPEVKKAGGVYYTPTYIVDYIVRQTVGALVADKRPGPRGAVSRLRILDPACGSGSFLLGAYQFLLDWHRDQYIRDDPHEWAKGSTPRLYQTTGGDWRLTTDERKRILLNNIYGVDIDPQAVEVTKLSLLLKVLEGENQETLDAQLRFIQERVLPDLENNIKCGNSLITPDFYDDQQTTFLNEDEMYRINVFDWAAEFPEIIAAGGFDAVIGNPPWGTDFTEDERGYLRRTNREIIVRMIDSFMFFVHQGSRKLITKGYLGMILPDVILYQKDNEKLRRFILKRFKMNLLLNMGNVFEKVTRPASIIIFENQVASVNSIKIADMSVVDKANKPTCLIDFNCDVINQQDLRELPGALFITSNPTGYAIWKKINSTPHQTLETLTDQDGIQRGVSPDLKKAFLVNSETLQEWNLEETHLKRVLTGGKHVKRYVIDYPDLWLIYTQRLDNFNELPNICKYISQFKAEITCKEVKQNKHPLYSLHRPRKEQIFSKDRKLMGVITSDRVIVALDKNKTYATDGLYLFNVLDCVDINYLMGVLNSKLFVFVYRLLTLEKGRVLAQVKPTTVSKLPIRTIDFTNPIEKSRHDQMVAHVERRLDLHKQLGAAKVPQTATVLKRQIDATDRQIDRLAYELYDLTAEEIKIVEAGVE
jgi:hypothetical protein